jgi:hypothetical protein
LKDGKLTGTTPSEKKQINNKKLNKINSKKYKTLAAAIILIF